MPRRRLDSELVRRGLVSSRSEAREAVRAGLVTVGGAPAMKPTTLVALDAPLHVVVGARPFASRGGHKLRAALDRFEIDVAGCDCLDAGASSGGFTDVLLRAGAARVAAVDVGYGQLAWELRTDPRVMLLERTNVRTLSTEILGFAPELVVADLSFMSLLTAIPPLARLSSSRARFVVLVKPQFEAEADRAPGGVVRDPDVWLDVLDRIVGGFVREEMEVGGVMASPLLGPAGNVEFLVTATREAAGNEVDLRAAIAEAEAVRS
jgi:23S rRNA (cytidine1920-2'-O)/16S rRNA (cytidine1409-2'-O)-methyltransferase